MTDAAPKTLLALSGADLTPGALSNSTLVLIDCQNEYVDGMLALPGVAPALDEAGKVLARARAAGTPVIHIQHQGKPGGPFDVTGHVGQIADAVAPVDGEEIIGKDLPNAFAHTTLDDAVKATGRKELILVGFMTHMCLSSTARAALDLGYRTTVVANAAATRPLPAPDGKGVIDADSLHTAALAALSDRFAVIAPDAASLPE